MLCNVMHDKLSTHCKPVNCPLLDLPLRMIELYLFFYCCPCILLLLLQVSLRIAGTAAGGTVGWAALHATHDPVLLLLIMCVVGVLLAPLASASFHFRLATALTVISMLVVVLCQFDPDSGESRATDTFYGTRLVEVGGQWGVGWGGVVCACVGDDGGVGGVWLVLWGTAGPGSYEWCLMLSR